MLVKVYGCKKENLEKVKKSFRDSGIIEKT